MVDGTGNGEIERYLDGALERKLRALGLAGKPLPEEELGAVFEAYDQAVASARDAEGPIGPDGVRTRIRDQRNRPFDVYRPLILDLPFTFDSRTLTLRHVLLSQIQWRLIEEWRATLLRTPLGGRPGKTARSSSKNLDKTYAPTTVNRAVTVLQSVVRWRVGEEQESPVRRVKRESTKGHGRKGYFEDEEQFDEFLRYCRPLLADMWRLSANNGGMRKSEVRLLTIREVANWVDGVIVLPSYRTKAREDRMFPVRPEELAMLKRRREAVEQLPPCPLTNCGIVEPTPHRHLFADPAQNGAPVCDRTMASWVTSAQKKSGLLINGERPVFHHGRHTWATWGSLKGLGLETLMDEGGWSTAAMAMHYRKQSDAIMQATRRTLSVSVREVKEARGDGRKPPPPPPKRGPAAGAVPSETEARTE